LSPAAPDYCTDDDYIFTVGSNEVKFGGTTDCTYPGSYVVNVYLIAWQKQSNGSYIRLRTLDPNGGPTPYVTGTYIAVCTPGHVVHTQYWTRVLTPSGVYITDTHTANTTPVTRGAP